MDFTSFSHLLADLSSPVSLTSSPRPMPTHLPSRPPAFLQEGIDAISDVIYHIETYDVTTIRASTPMFLMSRKIKALGVKMVLSGEGSDEIFGGYLYFHKAPDKAALHEETCQKVRGGGGGMHTLHQSKGMSLESRIWQHSPCRCASRRVCWEMEVRSGMHACACSFASCAHVLCRLSSSILSTMSCASSQSISPKILVSITARQIQDSIQSAWPGLPHHHPSFLMLTSVPPFIYLSYPLAQGASPVRLPARQQGHHGVGLGGACALPGQGVPGRGHEHRPRVEDGEGPSLRGEGGKGIFRRL